VVLESAPDKALEATVDKWLEWDLGETRQEVERLLDDGDWTELAKIMAPRLEFGTAGIRGRMGAGFGRMNDLVIIQVGQGLLAYLLAQEPNLTDKGVVVGFDGRHNSRRWAFLTAGVFIRAKVPVILFRTTVPTPFVPFTVMRRGAAAGVMVTASHNPRWDNGYKVYWGNGAQILAPHDKNIQAAILGNLAPQEGAFQEPSEDHPLLSNPLEQIQAEYMSSLTVHNPKGMNSGLKTPIVYTAMHGVGWPYCQAAWQAAGFPPSLLVPVPEQKDPHPDFPTVEYPNPEEGASSLDLAFRTAEASGASYILANDPDADRLACAQKIEGGWRVFNGNELGALLGHWLVSNHLEASSTSNSSKLHLLASTVSSKFLDTLARAEGLTFTETLTGFKHMGNVSDKLIQQGERVLFAYEEAIGFMCGSAVLDKDGVSALVCLSELITRLEGENSSLSTQLDQLYNKYGLHTSLNSYYICHEPAVTASIFTRIRRMGPAEGYPDQLGGARVTGVRDLTTGYDSTQPDKKAILPVSASSQMITFWLQCEDSSAVTLTLRTSGTEPKIKYYTEMVGKPGATDKQSQAGRLDQVVGAAVEEMLQPKLNGLKAKSN